MDITIDVFTPQPKTGPVTYDYIKSQYIDPLFGGNDVDDDVNLFPTLSREELGSLLEEIGLAENCEDVHAIGFGDDARIFQLCRQVTDHINCHRSSNPQEPTATQPPTATVRDETNDIKCRAKKIIFLTTGFDPRCITETTTLSEIDPAGEKRQRMLEQLDEWLGLCTTSVRRTVFELQLNDATTFGELTTFIATARNT